MNYKPELSHLADYHHSRWMAAICLIDAKEEYEHGYEQLSWESLFEWRLHLDEGDQMLAKLKPVEAKCMCLLRGWE
jgi:hypothetical protein